MALDASWMSCRPAQASRGGISLLPQFNTPPAITDFALENKPPSLPPRNSPARIVVVGLVAVMCFIGSCAVVSAAAEPVVTGSKRLASGMKHVVGTAISRANEQAERNAAVHYSARQDYLERRAASRRLGEERNLPVAAAVPLPLKGRKSGRSSLLLRMAALQALENPASVDETAVRQYFPSWVTDRAEWDEEAVLHDLVLAVSHLAHQASIDGRQGT